VFYCIRVCIFSHPTHLNGTAALFAANEAEPLAVAPLQHTATYCNTLQHTATSCNTPQRTQQHTLQQMGQMLILTPHTPAFSHPTHLLQSVLLCPFWCVAVCCSVLQCVAVCCILTVFSHPTLLDSHTLHICRCARCENAGEFTCVCKSSHPTHMRCTAANFAADGDTLLHSHTLHTSHSTLLRSHTLHTCVAQQHTLRQMGQSHSCSPRGDSSGSSMCTDKQCSQKRRAHSGLVHARIDFAFFTCQSTPCVNVYICMCT